MNKDTKGVIVFLLLTFGIAWGFLWLILPPAFPPPGTPGWMRARNYSLVGFVPMIAAFIVRKWVTREGFGDAGLGLHLRRWRYYVIAFIFPWVVLLAIALEANYFGLAHPHVSIMESVREVFPNVRLFGLDFTSSTEILVVFGIVALVQSPVAFGEEFGWRGYLQMRLFPSRPLAAALATGLIGGLWHLPVILRDGGFSDNRLVTVLSMCAFTMLLGIIFSWLRLRSGSVWVTCVAHSTVDVVLGLVNILVFFHRGDPIYVWGRGVLSLIFLTLVCTWIVLSGQLHAQEPICTKSTDYPAGALPDGAK